MKKLFRFGSHELTESDIFNKQTIRIDNTYTAEFYGDLGRYEVTYHPEPKLVSVVFSNQIIKYYRLETLLKDDDSNPLSNIEDGKLLSFIMHAIYTHDYNKTAFVDSYTVESACEAGCDKMRRFLFSQHSGGYTVTYDIDEDGFIVMTLPERRVIGNPVQISASGALGDIEGMFGGELILQIAQNYEKVTGRKFRSKHSDL